MGLDALHAELDQIPKRIAAIKADIQAAKAALEAAKKDLTQLQLAKKQKELDLESQEASIRKHAGELNAVKTNEAYKALLGEMDKAKEEKSSLEDQILLILEQTDQAMKVWKDREATHKAGEDARLKEISDWETKQKDVEREIADKQAARQQSLETMPKTLSGQYERLRNSGNRGRALVPIRNEQCGGCHMRVSQNLINEVRRGQRLMTCESCSRIVYLEEVPAAPK